MGNTYNRDKKERNNKSDLCLLESSSAEKEKPDQPRCLGGTVATERGEETKKQKQVKITMYYGRIEYNY